MLVLFCNYLYLLIKLFLFLQVIVGNNTWRDLQCDFTSTSFTQLSEMITTIMKEVKLTVNLRKATSIVCMKCFNLLDRVDDLQYQLEV